MRNAWVSDTVALKERMVNPAQLEASVPEVEMPAYMESFLAHLRLLVGVPFDYLVPDSRLLPDETIRFFYLDRSWTDRLVDGAISVGKIGTREQAHHHAHHAYVRQQLDSTEHYVRDLQRAKTDFGFIRNQQPKGGAGVITGFLLRSGAVSGWPHMDVRAYKKVLPAGFDPNTEIANQLPTLRLERLSPAVLLALFDGIPKMVMCEEPHHGIQFAVHGSGGVFSIFRRNDTGIALTGTGNAAVDDIRVPVRKANQRVLGIAALRRALIKRRTDKPVINDDKIVDPTGAATLAIALLSRPWRQRFQEEGGKPQFHGRGEFIPNVMIAPVITQAEIRTLVKEWAK